MPDVYEEAYGQGALFLRSVLDAEDSPAGLTLETGMTFAAADVKVLSDEQGATNAAAESRDFTSGSEKPRVGQQLSGATSTETCTVIGVVLTSGSWSGGDAAGRLFVEGASGAFQSENLDNDTTGTSDVMTIGGDFDGFAAYPISNSVAVALTSSELTCQQCSVEIVDATATEVWLEDQFTVRTIGHPNAHYQPEGNAFVLHDGVLGTNPSATVVHMPDLPSQANDDYNHYLAVFKDVSAGAFHSEWIDDWAHSSKQATLENALPFTPSDDVDLYWVTSIRRDTEPAKFGGSDSAATSAIVEAVESAAIFTTALSESYGTDGSALTAAELLYLIYALLGEFATSGTTVTVKKLDGSSTAATFTLDDAGNPTTVTRNS